MRTAFLSAADHYARIEELPSGRGYADMAYLLKRGSSAPVMMVELKWNKPVRGAIAQVRDKNYPALLRELDGPILLVGITYDAKTKERQCVIDRA